MKSVSRLRSLAARHASAARASSSDMDDELRFHIEAYADDLVRAGLSPEEARRRARVEFGGVEAARTTAARRSACGCSTNSRRSAATRAGSCGDRPASPRSPILSLALGIGANTAIFSLMEAALWKPMPVRDPERLRLFSWVSGPTGPDEFVVGNWHAHAGGSRASTSFSYPCSRRSEARSGRLRDGVRVQADRPRHCGRGRRARARRVSSRLRRLLQRASASCRSPAAPSARRTMCAAGRRPSP